MVVNEMVSATESVTATLSRKLCLICKRELKPFADFVTVMSAVCIIGELGTYSLHHYPPIFYHFLFDN